MTYEETKELLDQYSIEDLRDLQKMINESISSRSVNDYKKMIKDFSTSNKVGDCFMYNDPKSNTLFIQFITHILEDRVETIRYDIDFDNNNICIYDDELIMFEVGKYKKSNTKESDMKKICDGVDSSVENIYKTAISDIIRLIETSDDV